jgi:DNA-directed RNA polymerase subunit RPC12/RpoP
MRYESAGQRCPHCRQSFRVLADEQGQHECPHCGFEPWWEQDEQDAEPDEAEPEGGLETGGKR